MTGNIWTTNLETAIAINVADAVAWKALSTLADYPRWNSRTRFRANAKAGSWRIMRVKLFRLWLPVPVKVLECSETTGLRWQGGIPGLFTGSHYFILKDMGRHVSLIQGEDFNGVLVPLLMPVIEKELLGLYQAFNTDLKTYCDNAD